MGLKRDDQESASSKLPAGSPCSPRGNNLLQVLNCDVTEGLATLADGSVNCCVTSPPYWGLRDYGIEGQIGLEKTPAQYVAKMVEVFREVRRVLRDAIKEPVTGNAHSRGDGVNPKAKVPTERNWTRQNESFSAAISGLVSSRNKRSVWTINTYSFAEAHFATYPPDLVKPCILAGCPVGGVVLDPFAGSGTTGMAALQLGRRAVLIELNPKYCDLIRQRCNVTPGMPL